MAKKKECKAKGTQMGLIHVSADKKAGDIKEGNFLFSLCIGKAEYYKFAWCTFVLILAQSSETPCFTYVPLTTRWHIYTPWDF